MSMNLLRLFRGRNASAPVARERLQILLAHERGLLGQSDLLATLREEILAVVAKHVVLDPDKVIVKLERGKTVSTLEVDIEVPNNFDKSKAPARAHGRLKHERAIAPCFRLAQSVQQLAQVWIAARSLCACGCDALSSARPARADRRAMWPEFFPEK